MWIKKLKLYNFRNYLEKEFVFNNKKVIISGKNGSGKTSLLEAIYLLSFGKSFKAKKDINLINIDHNESYISGEFYTVAENELDIAVSISMKKHVKINNKNIERLSQLIGRINIILFIERDIDLIEQSPEIRRRFIDIIFSQMDSNYLNNLIKYRKVLEDRNYYLRIGEYDENLIESYNRNLVNYGAEIIYFRMKYLKDFFSILKKIILQYNINSLKDIYIKYFNNILNTQGDEGNNPEKKIIKDLFYQKLTRSRKKEASLKFTFIGPHRDDIIFLKNNRYRFTEYSSTGERRLLSIAMKITEADFLYEKKKDLPILLLDDIFLELDKENKELIINYINLSKNQFFVTTTDKNEYSSIGETDLIQL